VDSVGGQPGAAHELVLIRGSRNWISQKKTNKNSSSRLRLGLNSRKNKLGQCTNWPAAWTSEGRSGLASRGSAELAQIWEGARGCAGQVDQRRAGEEELGPNGGELRARIRDGGKAAARLTKQRSAR
jgi:hypothetical protein